MNNLFTSPIQDEEIFNEAKSWLDQMVFSPIRGDFAEGENVIVMVEPHCNDNGDMQPLVTCLARGHRNVDWRPLVVCLLSEHEEFTNSSQVTALNRRGQAWLPGVRAEHIGTYRLHAEIWRPIIPPVTYISVPQVVYARALPRPGAGINGLAARGAEHPEKAAELKPAPLVISEMEEKLRITIQFINDLLQIAFETNEGELAGQEVHFVLSSESGDEQISGETVLTAVPGKSNMWEGAWQGKIDFKELERIVYELKPSARS
ncbi:MAG: hypothetical protein ABSE63_01695 [Thermoguttaceae bacterium]|jgi:hypothetical protein